MGWDPVVQQVETIPDDAVDWVLLQLVDNPQAGEVIAQKSVFLKSDGLLMDLDGQTGITLQAPAGSYYLMVKHRNHLPAASCEKLAFDTKPVSYDFTIGTEQYYQQQGVKQRSGSNVYMTVAGDIDQDGYITSADYVDWFNAQNQAVQLYTQPDINFDGKVDLDDYILWLANARSM
jgi:hypothetical protein